MGNKSDCRFVVECEGKLLRLFSITERKNFDVVIKPQQAEFYRDAGTEHNNKNPIIKNQKYSIHCSNLSTTNINAIVHTLDLSSGETKKTRNYTKALKENNLSALLYFARCPDLNNPNYHTDRERNQIVSLGNYNPKEVVLYYMIIVSNKDQTFNDLNFPDLDSYTYSLNKFNISVIWSFAHMPSDNTGDKLHLLSIPTDNIPKPINQTQEGFTKENVINNFRRFREYLDNDFKQLLLKRNPEIEESLNLLSKLGFSKKMITH